jgi:hypothetical protein
MLIYTGRKTRVGDHEFYSVGDVPIRVSTTVKIRSKSKYRALSS